MKAKKSVQRILFALAICVIELVCIIAAREEQCSNFGEKKIKILLPDNILIYKNGNSYEVNPSSKDFAQIYKSCNEIPNESTMESAIDNDIVEEVKSQVTMEYVYVEKKSMRLNNYERRYTKLLFNLEGQDNVILYESGYKSGTYRLGVNKLLLKARLQRILLTSGIKK